MKVSLVMFKEDGQQKTFDLDARTIVGRKDDCDLRIPLEQVSRRHAMLMVTDKTVTIRDLGSSNGTYVNNERVTEQDLAPGDRVVIGPVVFTVQVNGQPADIKPAHTRLETKASLTKTGAAGATAPGARSVALDTHPSEREVAMVPGEHDRVGGVRRCRDERIGQAQVAAASTGGRTPRTGEQRRVGSGQDELDRLEERGETRQVLVQHPSPHLATDHVVDKGFVPIREQPREPATRLREATKVIDHERRVQHVAHRQTSGPGSVSSARRARTHATTSSEVRQCG